MPSQTPCAPAGGASTPNTSRRVGAILTNVVPRGRSRYSNLLDEFTWAMWALLLATCVRLGVSSTPFPSDFQRGIVFGGDEWSSPVFPYGSAGALASLTALAATGASHVRLLVSGFMDNAHSATRVYSIPPPSALATVSVEDFSAAVAHATGLGLHVVLCPVLDPNWDLLPAGARSTASPNATWRGTIGDKWTSQAEFDAWFASYRAWAWPYYQAAAAGGAWMIEVSSELDFLFAAPQAEAGWRALIVDLRALFPGRVSCAVVRFPHALPPPPRFACRENSARNNPTHTPPSRTSRPQ